MGGQNKLAPSQKPQVLTNTSGEFRQLSDVWLPGASRPLFADELEALRASSINLFNSLANVAPSGPRMPGGKVVSSLRAGYDVPKLPQRPVAADYPKGVPANAAGRITHDIDGRPLTAPFVAGRSQVGENYSFPDRGFDPATVVRVGEEAGGAVFLERTPSPKGGGGSLHLAPGQRPKISVASNLSPGDAAKVQAHEVGHLLDEIVGKIDTKGLSRELEPLYNRLLTGEARTKRLTLPQHVGYSKEDAPRELIAEALRAYMTEPNTMKAIAPKTAARIREAVNTHPQLSRWVQFNALAPAGMMGIGESILGRGNVNGDN